MSPNHMRRRTRRSVEELEPRLLMAVSPQEQLFVYLLNRARHDPVDYQQENNLLVDLSYVTPRAPLAVNDSLFNSSEFHAQEMAVNNYFGHQSQVTGQWPNQMARNAGYVLPSSWSNSANYIESLAAGTFYSTATQPLNALIVDQGVPSLGHRNHLLSIGSFNAGNREIGVGHAFSSSATYRNYWGIHATRTNTSDRFLTGVVYSDTNGNSRYDLNEGLSNVTITAGAEITTTNAAGGWSIRVGTGSYNVMASGGSFVGTSTAIASAGSDSVEVDFISGNSQGMVNFEVPPPPPVSLAIADASVSEGHAGARALVFNVTLSAATSHTVTVSYSLANDSAIVGSDFISTAGALTFSPGSLSRQITVFMLGDLLIENDETFLVNLSSPTGATLGDGQAVGTIVNDDATYARPNEIMVVAPGPGRETSVRVLDRATGMERFRFEAFPGSTAGVQVATGDVTGDGVLDIIVGTGQGASPEVRVFDGTTGNPLAGNLGSFLAYSPAFHGGVFVASADFNGDGRAEIITGAGNGGGPQVRIFNGANGWRLASYFGLDTTFYGGVRVAAGDINGDGTPDVITGGGSGASPQVRVYSGLTTTLLRDFFAYSPAFMGGVYVAAGDVNGDGRADIVTGADRGGGPQVRAFDGVTGARFLSFFAFASSYTGGVRVALADVNGDGRADIIAGTGIVGSSQVRVLHGVTQAPLLELAPYEASFTSGIFVAGSSTPAGSSPSGGSPTVLLSSDAPPDALDERILAIALALEADELINGLT